MTIEEVIAIANTLRDGFFCLSYSEYNSRFKLEYVLDSYGYITFSGFDVEEALRNAGWKG